MSSKIEWTDETWNPITGCDRVSAGCDHCYALTMAGRLKAMGAPGYDRDGDPRTSGPGFAVALHPERLAQPITWRRPRRIFVCSMADLFHDDVPDRYIAQVFAVMALASQHTFQVLTKRHGRMRSLLNSGLFIATVWGEVDKRAPGVGAQRVKSWPSWPLPNVWLGVSTENQQWADIRIPALLRTPAAVRWISAEPLLGPIDLRFHLTWPDGGPLDEPAIDWVVAGGESGRGARPMHPGWAASIRDQCARAGVAFLHKQNGAYLPVTDEPRPGDVWVHGDGLGTTPWTPETRGAEAGRWSPFADVVVRPTTKKDAGRELDGRTHDGYPA